MSERTPTIHSKTKKILKDWSQDGESLEPVTDQRFAAFALLTGRAVMDGTRNMAFGNFQEKERPLDLKALAAAVHESDKSMQQLLDDAIDREMDRVAQLPDDDVYTKAIRGSGMGLDSIGDILIRGSNTSVIFARDLMSMIPRLSAEMQEDMAIDQFAEIARNSFGTFILPAGRMSHDQFSRLAYEDSYYYEAKIRIGFDSSHFELVPAGSGYGVAYSNIGARDVMANGCPSAVSSSVIQPYLEAGERVGYPSAMKRVYELQLDKAISLL